MRCRLLKFISVRTALWPFPTQFLHAPPQSCASQLWVLSGKWGWRIPGLGVGGAVGAKNPEEKERVRKRGCVLNSCCRAEAFVAEKVYWTTGVKLFLFQSKHLERKKNVACWVLPSLFYECLNGTLISKIFNSNSTDGVQSASVSK